MGGKEGTGKKFDFAEMCMLGWMFGVTKLDKIRNKSIRGATKVGKSRRKSRKGGWDGTGKRRR